MYLLKELRKKINHKKKGVGPRWSGCNLRSQVSSVDCTICLGEVTCKRKSHTTDGVVPKIKLE